MNKRFSVGYIGTPGKIIGANISYQGQHIIRVLAEIDSARKGEKGYISVNCENSNGERMIMPCCGFPYEKAKEIPYEDIGNIVRRFVRDIKIKILKEKVRENDNRLLEEIADEI